MGMFSCLFSASLSVFLQQYCALQFAGGCSRYPSAELVGMRSLSLLSELFWTLFILFPLSPAVPSVER